MNFRIPRGGVLLLAAVFLFPFFAAYTKLAMSISTALFYVKH